MFVKWLRLAYEDHDEDVVACVVFSVVAVMWAMPSCVRPEAVPAMAGLFVAVGCGLGPGLWRGRCGVWTGKEMNFLEVTAFLLVVLIDRLAGDWDFASCLIAEALFWRGSGLSRRGPQRCLSPLHRTQCRAGRGAWPCSRRGLGVRARSALDCR
ncbi:hypothetical protein ACFYV5_33990 [Streptomyces sp. NPDC003035]|uniref:hypothetical protein n=1 Tax=Streptomyces sp. NPDC003035 TaxID=3364676 RepID=UPI0036C79C63